MGQNLDLCKQSGLSLEKVSGEGGGSSVLPVPGVRVYSHISGIYKCVAFMGGFLKRFAPIMGTFF